MSYGEAIRNPTNESASNIAELAIPDELNSFIPNLVKEMDTKTSEELAGDTLDTIFNVVEERVLGEGVDYVFDNFLDRIVDLVVGNYGAIFERVSTALVGS